ncbi:asparagine synthase-related protein [Streptomyces sp. MS19]|uniref:asparagine synthase-related protein n=1 Tax=Streptomyces sp. MS19 TaxID=3385972 RepID=UPI00399FA6D7
MTRFVAGRFATGAADTASGLVPRRGREVVALPTGRVWTAGHTEQEVAITDAAPGGPGARLITVGCCLATPAERKAAVLAARLGNASPAQRLAGSYLSVVDLGGEVWVAGDGAGVVPLYWLPEEDGLWWPTMATPLAALSGARPDPAWLLAELTVTGVDFRRAASHFEQVRRVPPGHALVLAKGQAPRVAEAPAIQPRCDLGEGTRRLRGAVVTAVTRRAHRFDVLSADLSGGVDSSTVTCMASEVKPLLAITYTDAVMAEDDDVLYARRIAKEVGGITHEIVDGRSSGVAHYDGLEETDALPATDMPSLTLALLAIKDAQLQRAAAAGSQAHLTGRGGDNILVPSTSHPVDHFLAGHRIPALRRAAAYARAQRVAPWRVWRQLAATAATSYPRALQRLAETLAGTRPFTRRPAPDSWAYLDWCSPAPAARWLTGQGRAAVAGLVGQRAVSADPHIIPAVLHDRLAWEWMSASHATFDAISRQRWGLGIHAPFLDTAVAEAAFGIPGYQRVRPGVYKPLAQAAFRGLAPDWLLQRPTKTAFTGSMYAGLAANVPTLRRILGNSRLSQAGLIDVRHAAADLDAAATGVPAPLADLHVLLVTELWLARLDIARATWWTDTPDVRSALCL